MRCGELVFHMETPVRIKTLEVGSLEQIDVCKQTSYYQYFSLKGHLT